MIHSRDLRMVLLERREDRPADLPVVIIAKKISSAERHFHVALMELLASPHLTAADEAPVSRAAPMYLHDTGRNAALLDACREVPALVLLIHAVMIKLRALFAAEAPLVHPVEHTTQMCGVQAVTPI